MRYNVALMPRMSHACPKCGYAGHSPVGRGDLYAANAPAPEARTRTENRGAGFRGAFELSGHPGAGARGTGLLQFTGEWPALLKVL